MAAHQDDLLGAQALGREHREQTHCSVTDHGHRGVGSNPSLDRGVVAGAEDVRDGEQRRDQGRVGRALELEQGALGQRNPDRLGLTALCGEGVPEAAVLA